eukprot:GHVP01047439.1.p1 GENE.GHVP01047439.1~~GHVP01047439.1.p1  ORF type:complete len:145 (+),score=29.15 GHVP01047439.1:2-436(+)
MAIKAFVDTKGKKKTAIAHARCSQSQEQIIRINGKPLSLLEPEILRIKVVELLVLIGEEPLKNLKIEVRVNGGGSTSRIYAVRQAMARAVIAYYQKYVDEVSKEEMKNMLIKFDRLLLVSDPRQCEMKKYGGRGARARFQKSYR